MNEVERLQRRLEREKQARKSAELIAETKTREIYEANLRLQAFNEHLEQLVQQRTAELESWRNAARRATAVGNLATHWQAEERRAAEKVEQKETDERSQQLWSRRTIAHGS